MKRALSFYCLPLIGLSISAPLAQAAKGKNVKKQKPNILILATDDQSYHTLRSWGNTTTVTPNMDDLVKNGTSFTETHVMGALGGAVSMPSRAMLMTGKYLYNLHQDGAVIPTEDKTIPEVFKENGYTTFATGKWHSDKASFNRSFTTGANIFFGGMHPYDKDGHFKPFLHAYDPSGKYQEGAYKDEFSSVCYANAAVDFLNASKKEKKPFFMYVAFTSPHDPRTPPPAYGHKYTEKDITLPLNFMMQHPFDNGDLDVRDEVYLPVPRDPDAVKKEIAAYYGMVSEVDTQIGRIIKVLEESGKLDNTIIVFTSDNGLAVGQHGLLGKQNLYEHSVRVPLVLCGPNIPTDTRVQAYCYLLDIFPTLTELAGIETPQSVDGKSFKKSITDNDFSKREHIYLSYINIQRAIKKDNYKLILYNVNGERRIQLFNLEKDPWERDNLVDDPSYKGKIDELTSLLYKEMTNLGDFCDPKKADWGYPKKLTWNEALQINP